jgi:hypothetical protein
MTLPQGQRPRMICLLVDEGDVADEELTLPVDCCSEMLIV